MNKKEIITVLILLCIVFAGISVMKFYSTKDQKNHARVASYVTTSDSNNTFWNYYDEATNFRHAGEIDSSISKYVKALTFKPDHQDALYYLGSMYMRARKYENAVQTWKQLVNINSGSARVYKQLGDLYFCRNSGRYFNPGRARAYFIRATELNREAMEPLIKLGEVALYQNHLKESSGIFTKLSQTNPKNAEAHFMLGYLSWKKHGVRGATKELSLTEEHADQLHVMMDESGGTAISKRNADLTGDNGCAIFVPWIKTQVTGMGKGGVHDADKVFASFDTYLAQLRAVPP